MNKETSQNNSEQIKLHPLIHLPLRWINPKTNELFNNGDWLRLYLGSLSETKVHLVSLGFDGPMEPSSDGDNTTETHSESWASVEKAAKEI